MQNPKTELEIQGRMHDIGKLLLDPKRTDFIQLSTERNSLSIELKRRKFKATPKNTTCMPSVNLRDYGIRI